MIIMVKTSRKEVVSAAAAWCNMLEVGGGRTQELITWFVGIKGVEPRHQFGNDGHLDEKDQGVQQRLAVAHELSAYDDVKEHAT